MSAVISVAGFSGDREGPELPWLRRRWLAEGAAQDQLDAGLDQLAAQLGLQLGQVRPAQDLVGDVEQDDRLVRPHVTNLAGQLDTDRARPYQQDPVRPGQGQMGLLDLLVGVVGVDDVGLGGERIARPAGQHHVVGGDLLARRRHHPLRLDQGGAIPHHPTVGQQPGVRDEDLRQPRRIDERPKSGDVVHERVLRLDQHDVARLIEGLGHSDAAVAATDHHHRRPVRLLIHAHLVLPVIRCGCTS